MRQPKCFVVVVVVHIGMVEGKKRRAEKGYDI